MYGNRESIEDLSVLDSDSHLFPLKPPAVVEFPGVTVLGRRGRPQARGGVSESTGVHGSTVQPGHLRSGCPGCPGVNTLLGTNIAVENGH